MDKKYTTVQCTIYPIYIQWRGERGDCKMTTDSVLITNITNITINKSKEIPHNICIEKRDTDPTYVSYIFSKMLKRFFYQLQLSLSLTTFKNFLPGVPSNYCPEVQESNVIREILFYNR